MTNPFLYNKSAQLDSELENVKSFFGFNVFIVWDFTSFSVYVHLLGLIVSQMRRLVVNSV